MLALQATLFGSKGKGESLLELIEIVTGNTKDNMWCDTADDQKKKEFYVDFKNGNIYSPTQIELKIINVSVRLVSRYIGSHSMVENLKPDDFPLLVYHFRNQVKNIWVAVYLSYPASLPPSIHPTYFFPKSFILDPAELPQ